MLLLWLLLLLLLLLYRRRGEECSFGQSVVSFHHRIGNDA